MRITRNIAATFLAGALALCTAADGQQGDVREQRELARGVRYIHIVRSTPSGEPWSIHVVEVSRAEKKLELRSVRGAGPEGEMQRERPAAMAQRAKAGGLDVVAVVNGDYDLGSPFLGISDGLSVREGNVSTTGKPTWPAMGLTSSGQPLIAVPLVEMTLESHSGRVKVAALNKPLSTTWGTGPYLYTREFRATLKSAKAFRAVLIGKLSRALPLRVDSTVGAVVEEILEGATQAPIAAGKLVLAEALVAGESGATSTLRAGEKVKLRIRVRINGQKIRDVVAGFPILVQEGRKHIAGSPSKSLSKRHPRTAFCYNPQKIIFAVVDGRQPQLSVGMTLEELADLMVELGCTTAMNSDGGGSSVMAVLEDTKGAQPAAPLRIVNSPSDSQERGRGNAWIIVRK
ncbi:MAG: phosphodiester glycosidase family protein [Acidobacteria bacterium]|nr:phosphodiester glycosidase family protein [Acidobacteriota bacterium]MCL5288183.1 phosphodiester glycosidase family protein [Acidobacteriota bacterium]